MYIDRCHSTAAQNEPRKSFKVLIRHSPQPCCMPDGEKGFREMLITSTAQLDKLECWKILTFIQKIKWLKVASAGVRTSP